MPPGQQTESGGLQVLGTCRLNAIPSTTYTDGSHSLKAAFDWATAP